MKKTILHIILLALFVLCVFGRRWIQGVFYPKRDGMPIKQTLYIVTFGLLVFCVWGRSWIPGIYYPAKEFVFDDVHNEPHLIIYPYRDGHNDFKSQFRVWTHIKHANYKKYKGLYIKKMSYEWEGNTGEFLKNGETIELKQLGRQSDYNGGWELDWGPSVSSDKFKFNPEKLFKGKKVGDVFRFYLEVVYSFNNEPEKTTLLEYNVKVKKGQYQSMWVNSDIDPITGTFLIFVSLIFAPIDFVLGR